MARLTQENYNMIVKILQNGAPALATELINAFNTVVSENEFLNKEIEKLRNEQASKNEVVENEKEVD